MKKKIVILVLSGFALVGCSTSNAPLSAPTQTVEKIRPADVMEFEKLSEKDSELAYLRESTGNILDTTFSELGSTETSDFSRGNGSNRFNNVINDFKKGRV